MRFKTFFSDVPKPLRANFIHLLADMGWIGVTNGTTLNFLGVYAARLGATAAQLGVYNAMPAITNILLTMPAGMFIQNRPVIRTNAMAVMVTRIFYLMFALLPFFVPPPLQIWAIIGVTLLMSIPATIVGILGNAFLGEAIPPGWRAQMIGNRNALLAFATMLIALVSGQILSHMSFPYGYQVIFFIGFLGSALSTAHVFLVRPVSKIAPELAETTNGVSHPIPTGRTGRLRLDILRSPFARVLVLLFFCNLSIFTISPIFPIYQVDVLRLTDPVISLGSAAFWMTYFLGSTQVGRISRRLSFQQMTGTGLLFVGLALAILTVSYRTELYLACQISSGIGWAIMSCGTINYLLNKSPADDRPAYLAWYNLVYNLAILLGSILGPVMSGWVGIQAAVVVFIFLRFLVGLSILRWGG
jgi:MFS family permease